MTEAGRADVPTRVTVGNLTRGLYDYVGHVSVGDRARRRYNPFAFDFDSTPMMLDEPKDYWNDELKALHVANREQAIERLKAEHGERRFQQVAQNTRDLGSKPISLISYHNAIHEQARRAFVASAYFPALVAACALGERILNHLILGLREHYTKSPEYKRVYRKKSFDDWPLAVHVLKEWGVLLTEVDIDFLSLSKIRNRSIHFDPATYSTMREDSLEALKTLSRIIERQFGVFGGQPWFIDNTPGAQFIRREWESAPFVRTYIVPLSGFVGVSYGMELTSKGYWRHLDYDDYGEGVLDDDAFARGYRERDPAEVVSREMIQQMLHEQQVARQQSEETDSLATQRAAGIDIGEGQ